MNQLRKLINNAYGFKLLKPVIEAIDGALFGSNARNTSSPHISDNIEIRRYMSMVILALMPATIAAVYLFGLRVLLMIAVSYIAGGAVEVAFAVFRKKEIHEGFLVTGLLYPLLMPPGVPLWVVAVGIMFGVFFGKELFGGTGRNIFNPALVGRLFVTVAFPAIMTTGWIEPLTRTISQATPLAVLRVDGEAVSFYNLLMGFSSGSIGEIFRLGLIVGGLFLIAVKVSNWRVPLSYLAGVALIGFFGSRLMPGTIAPATFQLLSGGLLLGAFFMATDPVTSTFTMPGKYIFGFGCAVFTVLIRSFTGFVEGVTFSILLMNALSPLIDHAVMSIKYRKINYEK